MRELERSLKALANQRRLAILKHLKENQEATVGELAVAIKLSFKSTSRHLAVLLATNIVDRDQRSTQMFYRLVPAQKSVVRHVISLV